MTQIRSSQYTFFVTAARGTEAFASEEARALGAEILDVLPGGVSVRGPLELGYRLCLWSRVAQRVLLPIAHFQAATAEELYEAIRGLPWEEHLEVDTPFEVECTRAAESAIAHSHYAALKTKDAIADRFRSRMGRRPSVRRSGRRLTIHLYLKGREGSVSVDLSGEPLYKRGYRQHSGTAPLKETLAAALLYAASWPQYAAQGDPLVDPFCGSGTIAIEAATMALRIAPGLLRSHFGFLAWRQHDQQTWHALRAEARSRTLPANGRPPLIYASDCSANVLHQAHDAAKRAGVLPAIRFARADARGLQPPPHSRPGLVLTNPPYGHRLPGDAIDELYAQFGDTLRHNFLGWTAFVFTGNLSAARHIGLRPTQRLPFWNGPIECRLLRFPIASTSVRGSGPRWRQQTREAATPKG